MHKATRYLLLAIVCLATCALASYVSIENYYELKSNLYIESVMNHTTGELKHLYAPMPWSQKLFLAFIPAMAGVCAILSLLKMIEHAE